MVDLFDPIDLLVFGIGDADSIVEFFVDIDVDVFIDCSADDRAAVHSIKRGQIAAAAHKAHSQGRSANDHRRASEGVILTAPAANRSNTGNSSACRAK